MGNTWIIAAWDTSVRKQFRYCIFQRHWNLSLDLFPVRISTISERAWMNTSLKAILKITGQILLNVIQLSFRLPETSCFLLFILNQLLFMQEIFVAWPVQSQVPYTCPVLFEMTLGILNSRMSLPDIQIYIISFVCLFVFVRCLQFIGIRSHTVNCRTTWLKRRVPVLKWRRTHSPINTSDLIFVLFFLLTLGMLMEYNTVIQSIEQTHKRKSSN